MHLKDLKEKTPAELVAMAEELGVESASTMRRQDLLFSILRELAEDDEYEEKRSKFCRTASAFCARPRQTICRAPMISMSRRARSALCAAHRRHGRG
jgi:hypothetical protein